jgi:hypothetical protein
MNTEETREKGTIEMIVENTLSGVQSRILSAQEKGVIISAASPVDIKFELIYNGAAIRILISVYSAGDNSMEQVERMRRIEKMEKRINIQDKILKHYYWALIATLLCFLAPAIAISLYGSYLRHIVKDLAYRRGSLHLYGLRTRYFA